MFLVLTLACNGPDQNINALVPGITVSPVEVDFGEVVVDYTETVPIEVINTGRAPLRVTEVSLETGNVYSVEPTVFELNPDERMELLLSFTPRTYKDYPDSLRILSNDPERAELVIPLAGLGGDGPTPDIDLDTTALDFGTVPPGATQTLYFSIGNVGDGPLHIAQTSQAGSGAFSVVTDPQGATVAEGGNELPVVVLYSPTHVDGDNGSFTINSDDPDEGTVLVTLLGNGGGDFEYPVAVIEGPLTPAPPTTAVLDGRSSFDPNGYELVDYTWSLVDWPEGSSTSLEETNSDTAELFFDIAGTYEVQLTVMNEYGITSAPAKYRVDAIPVDAIHVELIWDTSKADLDLHMLETPETAFFDGDGDVCFCNPNPSWGGSGEADDPRLDIDDLSGKGPENINILEPADGDYPVRVHYFDDNGDGAVTATVRVYLLGELELESSKVLERDQVWSVGTVKWPDGVVVDEDDAVIKAPRRSCK